MRMIDYSVVDTNRKKLKHKNKVPDFKLLNLEFKVSTLKNFQKQIKVFITVPSIIFENYKQQILRIANEIQIDFFRFDTTLIVVSFDNPFVFEQSGLSEIGQNIHALSTIENGNKFAKNFGVKIKNRPFLYHAVFIADELNQIRHVQYALTIKAALDEAAIIRALTNLVKIKNIILPK